MTLFTIIVDYRGGTYLSQVVARSVAQALSRWADTLDATALGGLPAKSLPGFVHELKDEGRDAAPISGLVGVWCITLSVDDCLALIHVVETRDVRN